MKKVLVLLLVLLLIGCAPAISLSQESVVDKVILVNSNDFGSNIRRMVDKEAGVVCYYHSRGLACVPLKDTALWLRYK